MSKYKVLLVDDEVLLLESLEIILELNDFEIIGKANDGNEALKILDEESVQCDIALVDLNMKGMGGLELIKIMKEKYPKVKVLVLTTFYDDKYITEAITNGADGYLLKDSGKDAIIGAITQILGGITVLDQKVMSRLAGLMLAHANSVAKEDNSINESSRHCSRTDRTRERNLSSHGGGTDQQADSRLFIHFRRNCQKLYFQHI